MVNKETIRDMYVTMKKIREFETKAMDLFAEGKIPGFVHLYIGEEAVAAGTCQQLRTDDYITSTHRGHGHIVAKGGELKYMMAELYGKATGYCKGKGGSMHIADATKGILGANGIVGAGQNIAVGAGLSAKYQGTDKVVVCFFGDASTNQGRSIRRILGRCAYIHFKNPTPGCKYHFAGQIVNYLISCLKGVRHEPDVLNTHSLRSEDYSFHYIQFLIVVEDSGIRYQSPYILA